VKCRLDPQGHSLLSKIGLTEDDSHQTPRCCPDSGGHSTYRRTHSVNRGRWGQASEKRRLDPRGHSLPSKIGLTEDDSHPASRGNST
jgi:hypothetical protein